MGVHRAASASRGRPGPRLLRPVVATLVALAVLVIAGAAARSGDPTPAGARLLLITTAGTTALGDADLVVAGARDAADTLGVELRVRRDVAPAAVGSVVAAAGPAGGVGIVDPPPGLDVAAGVPVALVDRGTALEQAPAPGSTVRLALRSDPARAGALAVMELTAAGARSIICLIDESAVPALTARCAGAVEAAPAGTSVEILHALDPDGDPSGITAAIAGRLIARPEVDAVLLARPGVEEEARRALDQAADARHRLLSVIGPEPVEGSATAPDPVADLGVDPRAFDQGWLLVAGLALAIQDDRPGAGTSPHLEVVPAAWPWDS